MSKNKKNLRLTSVSAGAETVMHIILGLFALGCVIPFLFVVIISFSSEESIRTIGYSFVPQEWSLETYQYAFEKLPQIWRSFFNSIFITVVGTVLSTAMCALYSYALYRPDFKFRNFFTFFSFFTMIFSGGLVPTYIISKQLLGLSENYAALIVPLLVSPFNIIVMRTFFKSSVPMELIEAATVDGSGEYSTLLRVVAPIAKPGIATIALLNALAYWNDWFTALIYLPGKENAPLPLVLRNILIKSSASASQAGMISGGYAELSKLTEMIKFSSVIVAALPMLIIYPFVQKYFEKGMMAGAVKG